MNKIVRSNFLTILELIEYATDVEKQDQEYYTRYIKTTERPGLKKLLSSLISQEKEHEKQLLEVQQDPIIGEVFSDAPADIDVAQFQTEHQFSEKMDYNDLLNLIIEREQKAADLYSFIASSTNYDEIRYFFENLAAEERKHKSWAVNRYELEMLSSF